MSAYASAATWREWIEKARAEGLVGFGQLLAFLSENRTKEA